MSRSLLKGNDSFVIFEHATLMIPSMYSRDVYRDIPRLHFGTFTKADGDTAYAFHIALRDLKKLESHRNPIFMHRLDDDTSGRRTLFGGLELRRSLDDLDRITNNTSIFRFSPKEYRKIASYFPIVESY